jgi:PAS domain S-box-containing protein
MNETEGQLLDTLEAVTEQMAVAVTRCSRDFRYQWANQAYANWIQRPQNEIVGHPILEVLGRTAFEELLPYFNRVLAGETVRYEKETNFRGIGPRWTSAAYSPTLDANGATNGWVAVVVDITGHRRAEQALRESEERFRSLYENSTLGLYRTTPDGKILLANPSLVKMLGYSSFSELAQRNLEEGGFEPGYERAAFQYRLATEGEITGLEASWTRKDGTTIFVRESAKAIRDAEGKTAYYEGTVEDITERRRAEEALRQSEEKFSKAFRESPLVVALTRMRDHRYLDVSESFEQWIGWRREEVIGRTPLDIGIWVDLAERSEFVKRLEAEGVVRNLEFRYRRKDGVEMVGLGSGELIRIGNEQCVISVITDITERKRAEEALSGMTRKLVEAQEQERARISRELHDDINQRIALLAIELDQLREKHKDLPSKVRGHVQKLQQMTSDISSRVYALSHKLYFSIPDSLGLAKGMRSWCREFGKQQEIAIDFKSHDLPRLPQEISLCLFRVLQEALHNAAKHSGVERIKVQLAENSGEIQLIVSDTGKGFDINAARRSGGLGLMSMHERVRLVGGTILIDSRRLVGTTIRVRVPFRAEHTG